VTHSPWTWLRIFGPLVLGAASLAWSQLALPAAFLTFIAWLSLPRVSGALRYVAHGALALAMLGASTGLVRFTLTEAAPGIIEAGQRAVGKRALSRLREFVFVQDVMRRSARIDADRDGVGAAGFIAELTATLPLRSGARLEAPLLRMGDARVVATPSGPAWSAAGYLFLICLPSEGGGFSGSPDARVDEERAERQWVAYAWPDAVARDMSDAYFIDQHERILVNARFGAGGAARAPACDAALRPGADKDWAVWEQKAPRSSLPGDR
jgi:hypothetical protein